MFREFYDTLVDRYGTSDSQIGLAQWVCENTTLNRKPFSFNGYEFQRLITDDEHHNLSVEKPSQVGMTEVQIRKFFAFLRRHSNVSGIFTFADQKMQQRNYNARMKPILEADRIFNPPSSIKPVRRMDQVQIFDSFGYITGCTEGDATSISADFLFHDELDLSPMDMIGLFQSRLQNSNIKITQAFSTPTYHNYGINGRYQLTDQREFMLKCEACNEWQIPHFSLEYICIPGFHLEVQNLTDLTEEQIAEMQLDTSYVKCRKCSRRLDLTKNREWVATYPTRTNFRGYKVRPFSASRLPPAYIFGQLASYQRQNFLRGFFNTVLGDPYTDSRAQIQREDIESCLADTGTIPNISSDTPVFLGLDMGQTCHLTLHTMDESGKVIFVLFEQIPIYMIHERIEELRRIYTIVQGCVDRLPYTPSSEMMRDNSGGIIIPVQYGGNAGIAPRRDEMGSVDYYTANRTAALDRVSTIITHKNAVLAGYGPYKETIIQHLRDMVRSEEPEKEPEWTKISKNDHFFHSMALSLLARRVCEHVYTFETASLGSTVILTGLHDENHKPEHLMGTSGAERIARLGVMRG